MAGWSQQTAADLAGEKVAADVGRWVADGGKQRKQQVVGAYSLCAINPEDATSLA